MNEHNLVELLEFGATEMASSSLATPLQSVPQDNGLGTPGPAPDRRTVSIPAGMFAVCNIAYELGPMTGVLRLNGRAIKNAAPDRLPTVLTATAPAEPMRYRSLDALRGVAALVVVMNHSMVTLPIWSDVMFHGVHNSKLTLILGTPPLDLLWAGNASVMVFFALSGFVLALMFLRPHPPSYAAFAMKRICRIYLPYIAVVAIAMLIMTATAPHQTPELSEWFNLNWNHSVSWPLILDHVLMLGQDQYNFVDNAVWSLVHEMRYPLIFPMIMWVVVRTGWRSLAAGSLALSLTAMGALSYLGDNWALRSLQY